MSNIDKHLAFVKEQMAVQQRLASKYADEPWRTDLHTKCATRFGELIQYLETERAEERLASADTPSPLMDRSNIFLLPKDIYGLPDELIRELKLSDSERLDFTIAEVIEAAGGVLSLDKILVAYWRRTGEVIKRNTMVSRLYRMTDKGMIYPLPNRKGIYATRELSDEEKRSFGRDDSSSMPEE